MEEARGNLVRFVHLLNVLNDVTTESKTTGVGPVETCGIPSTRSILTPLFLRSGQEDENGLNHQFRSSVPFPDMHNAAHKMLILNFR